MYRIVGADQQEYGPVTADQVREWVSEGRANAQTKIKYEGTADWKPLAEFPEFADLLRQQPPAAPPPAGGALPPPGPGRVYPTAPLQKNNSMALTGFVCGLLSLVCCGPLFGLLGIIFSFIGLNQINQNPQQFRGKGLAIAGIILSIVGIIISILILGLTDWEELFRQFEPA